MELLRTDVGLRSDFFDEYDHLLLRATDKRANHVWDRLTRDRVLRRTRLSQLAASGLQTVPNAPLDALYRMCHIPSGERAHHPPGVVVYEDEFAHAGEGKRFVAWEDVPAHVDEIKGRGWEMPWASVYLGDMDEAPQSLRLLCWPDRFTRRWYRYTSSDPDEWRSNAGAEVVIEPLTEKAVKATSGLPVDVDKVALALSKIAPLVSVDFAILNGRTVVHSPASKRRLSPRRISEALGVAAGARVQSLYVALDLNTAPRLRGLPGDRPSPSDTAQMVDGWFK